MAFEFLIVRGEVLYGGDDALALHALYIGDTHPRRKIWILAVAFKVSSPQRHALNVDSWAKDHVAADRPHFLCERLADGLRDRWIPCRCNGDSRRKRCAVEMVLFAAGDCRRSVP